MTDDTADLIRRLRGPVRQAAQDLIDAAFNNREGRGVQFSIPAKPNEDTDLVLVAGIKEAADALEAAERVIRKAEQLIVRQRPTVLNPHVTDNYFGDLTVEGERLKDDIDAVLLPIRDWLAQHATSQRKGGGDDND